MQMLKQCLAIGVAGSLGALARFFVTRQFSSSFPIGTMVINISGCFILGFFLAAIDGRIVSDTVKFGIGVGFVGAYTTFSTWMYDSVKLLEKGQINGALLNIFLSIVLGLAAVWLGAICGRRI
jgi:fluoride exporter